MDEKLSPPSKGEQEQILERERVSRRTFLMNVGIALNAGVALLIATPVVAYLLGPVLRRKNYLEWVTIGNVSDFPPGETKLVTYTNPFSEPWDGASAKVPAYVRCSAPGEFTVFAINCAHLGCPVRWFSESQLFMCPCHGGLRGWKSRIRTAGARAVYLRPESGRRKASDQRGAVAYASKSCRRKAMPVACCAGRTKTCCED